MSKYDPLTKHLKGQYAQRVSMSFAEVERVIDAKLPRSAHEHAAWWANHPGETHVQAKAWMDAGFEATEIDRAGKQVVSQRLSEGKAQGMAETAREFAQAADLKPRRSPLFGAMKGTFWIDPSWDLTKPSLDPEELEEWEASLDRKADRIEAGLRRKP
jgi:hypothetical protein